MVAWSRPAAVGLHAWNVLAMGWLDAVRAGVGNLLLVDELLAASPPLAVFIAGWWAIYPVERRLREAMLMRRFDEGLHVPALPTRRAFVVQAARHHVLFAAVPVALILGWAETVLRLAESAVLADEGVRAASPGLPPAPGWAGALPAWAVRPEFVAPAQGVLQLAGVVVVIALLPLALRWLWDTVPLAAGELRDRLERVLRSNGVRVRGLLVWRTDGTMLNGAVVGFLGPARYVLLTDALLESLPADEVEAVMAHEVGHVRQRHAPWLAAAFLGSATVAGAGASAAGRVLGLDPANGWPAIGVVMVSLAVGLAVFGFVSRRFEWQADAFAARHLSASTHPPPAEAAGTISHEAARAMASALGRVAMLNGSEPERFSWRHGSIGLRRRRLRALIGAPLDRMHIDAVASHIKIGVAFQTLAAVAMIVAETVRFAG
ncbi:MAG: M48 family metalloprotease [Phycisphaeraceae bacterium]|nr:M48 family metalloprotease [Phycisphaeraceae bacterium]